MRTAMLSLSCVLSACGGVLPVSVAQFHPSLLPSMVGKKIETPLFLLVGPSAVPDKIHVQGETIVFFTIPDVDLVQVRTFATRDLRQALETHFAHVNVIYDPAQLPATRHLRAEVKLTKVDYERRISAGHNGQHNEFFGAVEWAFGIKRSDEPEFAYNFSERTISSRQMTSFSDTDEFSSAFEDALRHLLADYDRSGVHQKLLSTEAPPANPYDAP